MAFTVTPNMSLRAIVEKDRTWYFDWVHNFNKLDGHRHITGEGRQIPTAGIADQAITAGKIANNAITDTQISATAAIQGTKITPNFGAQDIATTGILTFDGTNGFRYNTGLLEYREGGGSWAQFSALAGANAQLSNLSSVSINQTLDFDTDDTYDLGTAITRIKEAFIKTINSTTGNITTINSTTVGATTGNITTINSSVENITAIKGNIEVVSALDIDWSTGTIFTKTIGADSVFTFSNDSNGQVIYVLISSSGDYDVTWPTIKWTRGTLPEQTPSGTDLYTFMKVGADIYGMRNGDFS